MPNHTTVTPRPSRNPDPTHSKDHHVGQPPTSFRNPWPSAGEKNGLGAIFAARFGSERNFVPVPQGPNGTRSEELVKVVKPDFGVDKKTKLRATWIGHASVFVEFPVKSGAERGIRVLFDPVFSERTSPFSWFGPKRYSPTPCTLDELPEVDLYAEKKAAKKARAKPAAKAATSKAPAKKTAAKKTATRAKPAKADPNASKADPNASKVALKDGEVQQPSRPRGRP